MTDSGITGSGITGSGITGRARAAGISPSYENWRHEVVDVPAESLDALLRALDRAGAAGAGAAGSTGACHTGAGIPKLPERRAWGFTVQLYSVRSAGSWGHGDLHDLSELAAWSASELGAGFILVNPLHAAEPLPPVGPSPYLPMTRMFTSPLYLRVEDIAEYRELPAADLDMIAELAAPLRARNTTADLIDRDAVWSAKRAALRRISQVRLSAPRQQAFDQFRAERGRALELWTAWCALAERHGTNWRCWPDGLDDPRVGEKAARHGALRQAADFHAWLQWHADEQLAAAQRAATAAGMRHGVIHDLAVGEHADGADAWAHPELVVSGVSVGAPPDEFNQLGQDWAQPPWHPGRLAQAGYQPLAELFGAALRHAGGLRVDHVMGLMRLWWVPAGARPDHGAYVRYDHEAAVAALAGAAARAGALAIGEDLGTVDQWIRSYLASQHVLGTTMLWFAREPDGTPLRPADWRRACMATVGTHDLPPVAGFVTGDQVTVRARLGLLRHPLETERASAAKEVARWQRALEREGLLAAGSRPTVAEFTVALYGYLHKTPALLIGVSLADAVGEVRTQNIPGTSSEYPNWQIPLCDAAGRAVLIEDLPRCQLLSDTVAAASGVG
jgi:4-alpha-glucanotransferase